MCDGIDAPPGSRCRKCGREGPTLGHHCHARGCRVATKPELLMCLKHWRMVPPSLKRAVWSTYRQGQCDDKDPSIEWHKAADDAIAAVAAYEDSK